MIKFANNESIPKMIEISSDEYEIMRAKADNWENLCEKMSINEWAAAIYNNSKAHGWWDEPRNPVETIALCHSELSEALEEDRAGHKMEWYACEASMCKTVEIDCDTCPEKSGKPEGVAVEMIDCIIRILDYLAGVGVDIEGILARKHEYNKKRPYKHGKRY